MVAMTVRIHLDKVVPQTLVILEWLLVLLKVELLLFSSYALH